MKLWQMMLNDYCQMSNDKWHEMAMAMWQMTIVTNDYCEKCLMTLYDYGQMSNDKWH
jgi:hypothetical protein